MIKSNYLQVQNYRLHCLDAGSGPPVVFLHGFAVSSEYWRPSMKFLTQYGYRAIAIDILGFGDSEHSKTAPYSLQLYADLFVGVLDALELQRAVFVGHSFGGKLALATAIFHPQRVSRLVMMDADGFTNVSAQFVRKLISLPKIREALLWLVGRRAVVKKQLEISFYNAKQYVTPELVERAQYALLGPENRAVLIQMSRNSDNIDLNRSGLRFRLNEVRCPTLIVWGESDGIFPPTCGEVAQREIPGSHLVIIPQCGHFPHLETFAPFHGLLLGFLAGGKDYEK